MEETKDKGQHATISIAESMIMHTGTKNVKRSRVPMTKAMYCEYRGWDVPEDEDGKELVYLVEYPADERNKPNHPDHLGYISMSPMYVFDENYMVSETFLDRLNIEKKELHRKMIALGKAIDKGTIPIGEEEILNLQLSAMTTYAYVLNLRIARAEKTVIENK